MRNRSRQRFAWVIVGGVIVGAFLAVGARSAVAGAKAQPPTSVGGVPVLASGVTPVTNGVVTASITPSTKKIGDSVRPVQVASGTIDSAGNFVIAADPGSGAMAPVVQDALAKNNGWINLDLTEIGADGETAVQSIARRFVNDAGQTFQAGALRTAGSAASGLGRWSGEEGDDGSTAVEPAHYAVVTQPSLAAARMASLRIAAASRKPLETVVPNAGCYELATLQDQTSIDTVVGEMHTADGIDKAHTYFTYGNTADSSLDVGIEASGSGSWDVSGSVHISNGAGTTNDANYPIGSQFGQKMRSGFLHQKWLYYGCVTYTEIKTSTWTLHPDGLVPGTLPADYVHDLDNNCKSSPYYSKWLPGENWARSANTFTHFDLGFNVWGFQGGTQSGASNYVELHYKWNNANSVYYLCGNDNWIAGAHRVYAGG
jgi:hypothetical protein